MSGLQAILGGTITMLSTGALAADHELYRRLNERSDRTVYRGSGNRRSVALTFDDGPTPQTPELLALLDRERVPATFFQLGCQVERRPSLTQAMHAAGHEIANHGWSHRRLSPQFEQRLCIPSLHTMRQELASTQRLLTDLCGVAPRYFRPPYGNRWFGLDYVQHRLHLTGVQWSVIGHDWEWPADRVASFVLQRTTPGGIICLHDGRDIQPEADISQTLLATENIIHSLRAQGYTFETVSSLLKAERAERSAMPELAKQEAEADSDIPHFLAPLVAQRSTSEMHTSKLLDFRPETNSGTRAPSMEQH